MGIETEKLDKALSDQIEKLGDLAPGIAEEVLHQHVVYYLTDAIVGMWVGIIILIISTVSAILCLRNSEGYGGAEVLAFISAIVMIASVFMIGSSIVIKKAPKAYAVKELTKRVLDR